MSCSIIALKNNENSNICLDKDEIIILIDKYNSLRNSNKITIKGKTKKELWISLFERMNKKCSDNDQICVIKNISDNPTELIRENFKPLGPKKKYDWLSTSDINNVMYHYEKKYPHFVFLGAIPRDFFNILPKLGGAKSITKLSKKAKKLGLIFNTDKHNQSGSHWLAVFIDFENNPVTIEHFDSVGSNPTKDIREFLEKIKNRINNDYILGKNKQAILKINKRQHQKGNNDCGVYSLHYIIERLKGKSFEEISEHIIRDSEMNKNREIYFRKNEII